MPQVRVQIEKACAAEANWRLTQISIRDQQLFPPGRGQQRRDCLSRAGGISPRTSLGFRIRPAHFFSRLKTLHLEICRLPLVSRVQPVLHEETGRGRRLLAPYCAAATGHYCCASHVAARASSQPQLQSQPQQRRGCGDAGKGQRSVGTHAWRRTESGVAFFISSDPRQTTLSRGTHRPPRWHLARPGCCWLLRGRV
eukprot:COSAG01_NODE_2784_length_7083_cov_306.080756_4_plen_197_part_00